MDTEQPDQFPIFVSSGSSFVFEKSGTTVRVGQRGVLEATGDPSVREEASRVFAAAGDWVGIHLPMAEAGFELIGLEVLEDMALDLLDDAASEAVEAAGWLRRAEESQDAVSRLEHRLTAIPHIRKATVLAAASAEAYINEFIARHLADRSEALGRLSPPMKWSVAVELATRKRFEDETDELAALKDLFRLRNRIMHFHPRVRRLGADDGGSTEKGSVLSDLQNEQEPMRFPILVVRCIQGLHRLTGAEDEDRAVEIISRAIDRRTMRQASDLSPVVGAVFSSLSPEDRASVENDLLDEWDAES